jgi:hypothetical protein
VLVDDPVARLAGEAADTERRDPEVMPKRTVGRPAVVDLVDRVEASDGVGGPGYNLAASLSLRAIRERRGTE